MSQKQKTIKLGNYAHYDVEKNELHTYEGIGLIEGLNQMFNVGILPQANKSRINVYNSTLTFEDGSVVTRLAPRELLQYLANEKGLPIDLNKSRAVQGYRRWILTFTEDYAKAVQKQEEKESIETETQIINNKEGNTNETHVGTQEKESGTNDERVRDEAGLPKEQEGTQDESGAPDLGADGSGSEQQPVVSDNPVVEQPVQPKKCGPKKKA